MTATIRPHLRCDICPTEVLGHPNESIIATRTRVRWHNPMAPSGRRRDVCPACWPHRQPPTDVPALPDAGTSPAATNPPQVGSGGARTR